MTRNVCWRLFSILSLTLLLTLTTATAQVDSTILSINVPEHVRRNITDHLINEFETAYPNVAVYVIDDRNAEPPTVFDDLEEHLDGIEDYVTTADVLYASPYRLSLESTRAGYWLDLAPLFSADETMDDNRIHPNVLWAYQWDNGLWAYQWDNGLWAIPTQTSIIGLSYDPALFDANGLPYPSASWTIQDFANAVRTLSQETGTPAIPGYGAPIMLRSFLGTDWYQDDGGRIVPAFDDPVLLELATVWSALVAEGVVDPFDAFSMDYPLNFDGYGVDKDIMPLPNDHLQLNVTGFAVSAGTQYPYEAYALAKFMAEHISTPSSDSMSFSVWDNPFIFEDNPALQTAMTNAVPSSHLHFAANLTNALAQEDISTALVAAHQTVMDGLTLAEARKDSATIVVESLVISLSLEEGVSLNFGTFFYGLFDNRSLWDSVIDDFIADDPEVREVLLTVDQKPDAIRDYDCFYTSSTYLSYQSNYLLDIRPLIDVDADFDMDDLLPGLRESLLTGNSIYGFPINITPNVLVINVEAFEAAGLPIPDGNWTITEFFETLRALKSETGTQPAIAPLSGDSSYLLAFLAASGVLPVDPRTNPPTTNFTNPEVVEVIRYILDLARDDTIDYFPLHTYGGGTQYSGGPVIWPPPFPIFGTPLTGGGLLYSTVLTKPNTYRVVNYPQGSKITAVDYSISVGVINAETPYPEACYRWLSTLSQHPELYMGIPARQSLIHSPAIAIAQRSDMVELYQQFDALLQNGTVINFSPSDMFSVSSPQTQFLVLWLNRAFNQYVLEDADLETALADAELLATAYLECVEQGGSGWECRTVDPDLD